MADIQNYLVPDKAPELPKGRKKEQDGSKELATPLVANVDAERVILAAILLDNEAFLEASEKIQPDDFFLDSHRRIFLRMKDLMDENRTIDIVTLANELTKNKEISIVGGVAYLADLTLGVPRRPVIAEYIRIIKDKSLARKIICLAGETTVKAYDQSQTALETATWHAGRLEEIIAGGIHKGLLPSAELSIEVMDRFIIQSTLTQSPGLSYGVEAIDEATGGIQEGEQVVIGCFSGVGKTTILAQIVAANCPKGHPMSLFLIEPTRHDFLRRLWSIVGQVRYTAVTKPWMASKDERERLRWAMNQVCEWPLYILDDSNMTLDEQLAHQRLAMHRHGVELSAIDYIQRMKVTSESKSDDTRLKIGRASTLNANLVKGTKCRNILLSQLSRSGGMNTIPSMDRLRECVDGDTLVIDAGTGVNIKVRDLQAGTKIIAVDDFQHIRPATVSKVWNTGVKPVFDVKTSTGKTIRCTANHPLRMAAGFVPVERLRVGDCIATGMNLPALPTKEDGYDFCRLLGYMTGDGSYLRSRSVSFISQDAETFADVEDIVKKYWPEITVHRKKSNYHEADFTLAGQFGNKTNAFRKFLQQVGVYGYRDSEKSIPNYVWERGREGAQQFLAGYLATDGCVKQEKYSNGLTGWRIHFDSTSYRLAQDIQMLLQRLGIVATISNGYTSKKATKPIYRIYVSSYRPNLLWFASTIPVRGRKSVLLAKAAIWCESNRIITNSGPFGLPPEISCYASIRYDDFWVDQGKRPNRQAVANLANTFGDQWLLRFAESDLLWEKVVSVEVCGEAETFDLTVPDTGAFLANGIVVHNSGQLENDAATILLLHLKYDEEQGHFTSEGAGIIPKQRFGVPCNVKLHKHPTTALWMSGGKDEQRGGSGLPYNGEDND